ncbi:MAG: sigma-70 family RNA polymerase sigma factor [Bryobacterales bacterium]|nr:sigma-70 family RNA polymerase sigma factor [Bryobacterales bacterium]
MALDPSEITQLLSEWKGGNRGALDLLMPVVMEELKRIAAAYLDREPGNPTLQTTALVHEAYLRLLGVQPSGWENRSQFFALSAQIMRRILVDHARARRGPKRGGDWIQVDFEDALRVAPESSVELTALDDALRSLEKFDPRKGQLVELRLFAGFSNEEAAEILGVSLRTVVRDWQFAKAWLARELGHERSNG